MSKVVFAGPVSCFAEVLNTTDPLALYESAAKEINRADPAQVDAFINAALAKMSYLEGRRALADKRLDESASKYRELTAVHSELRARHDRLIANLHKLNDFMQAHSIPDPASPTVN